MKAHSYNDFLTSIENLEQLIEQYEQAYDKTESLGGEIDNITDLREGLYDKYANKYGYVETEESGNFSMEELEAIRAELADTSLLALIKRLFGIGGRRDEIYFDLMTKIQGLLLYLEDQFDAAKEREEACKSSLTGAMEVYERLYNEIQSISGCAKDSNWWEFNQVDEVAGDLYFCDMEIPAEAEVYASEALLAEYMPLSYRNKCFLVPYTRSLSEPIQFLYEFGKDRRLDAIQSVKSLVYQMVRMTPEYYMQMHLMDGENTGSDFAELIELQKVREADQIRLNRKVTNGKYKMAQLYLTDADISQGLKDLDQYMTVMAAELGAFGSLAEYNAANSDVRNGGKGLIPYQTVIIENFPTGFNDDDIKLLDKLIRNGQKRGISIILLNNEDRWIEQKGRFTDGYGNRIQSLQDKIGQDTLLVMDTIRIGSTSTTLTATDCSSVCSLQLMRAAKKDYIKAVVQAKTAVKEIDNYFPNVFRYEDNFGTMDATKSLRIPFALDRKGNVMEYRLGEAMNAHGLISGGTGSGKSTLLHMLISSIVMNYSPQDVEIWLADYKITEFYSYKTNTPPHVRFIGLSKTEDFSFAFIDKITSEMNRRQNVIAMADYELKQKGEQTNITNFKEYRDSFGADAMTRLIVIIDEFHVMAQHAQSEPEYKQKLENLLAEARALGIILLFSDQAIVDGLRGLSDKGKKQIKARIAMSNYEDELKETLNEREREKIKPYLNLKVGEIAVQTVTEGRDEDGAIVEFTNIERGRVVYIDGGWRYKVCAKAREVYQARDYQSDYFDDREIEAANWENIARWEEKECPVHRNGERDLQIHIGRPVNLELSMHFPLLQRKGNNIMSVAGTEEQQMRVILAGIESFRRQNDYEICIFADPYASVYREFQAEFLALARQDRHIRVADDLSDICYEINTLLGRLGNRGNTTKTMILWLGLDMIADACKEEQKQKPAILKQMSAGSKPAKKKADKPSAAESLMSDLATRFDDLFGSEDTQTAAQGDIMTELVDGFEDLFGPDPDITGRIDEQTVLDEAEMEEPELSDTDYLYDACDDIVRLIHMGPVSNLYNMVVYDSAVALKDFRDVKITDFNHRIAFVMSDSEASDFLERSNLIRTMPEQMAYYFNGRSGRKFIPYRLDV